MDIRLPIGLLFSSIGTLLTVFGLISDAQTYQRSLGINVNLWWGLALILFGGAFLFGSRTSTVAAEPGEDNLEP